MSTNNSETTVYVPESKEPDFPVNITSWKHYTSMRLLCMVILAWTLLGFIETTYVTTVRISEIWCEARTRVCSRGKLGRGVDNVKRYWWGQLLRYEPFFHVVLASNATDQARLLAVASIRLVG